MWFYFWALFCVSLICVYVFSVLYCHDHCGLTIRYCESFNIALLSQNCLGECSFFVISYKFHIQFVSFYKNPAGMLIRENWYFHNIESSNSWTWNIFTFIWSSLVSFISILQFSAYRFCTYFGRFILKHFIFFWCYY